MLREARVEAAEARRAAETGVADDGSRAHPHGTDDVEGRRSGLSRSLEVPPPPPPTPRCLSPHAVFARSTRPCYLPGGPREAPRPAGRADGRARSWLGTLSVAAY
jgi:hypothetical protein